MMKFKRSIFAACALLCAFVPAIAQKSKSVLSAEITSCFPTNTVGAITPTIVISCLNDLLNSWQQYAGVNAQVGTSYNIQQSDYGQLVTFTNASPVTVGLSQAVAPYSTFNFYAANLSAGTVTISPTSSTINGLNGLTLATGQAVWVVSDGTNWQAVKTGLNASQFTAGNCITITGTTTPTIAVAGTGCITTSLISNGNVTNAILSPMNASTIKANVITSTTANPTDATAGQLSTILCQPVRTVELTGTNATFTVPTCNGVLAQRLEWELVGGGGGGAGSGTTPGAAGSGTATCVNTSGTACSSSLFQANGGANGLAATGADAAGGTTSGCDLGLVGGAGGGAAAATANAGGAGGISYFGGSVGANVNTAAAHLGSSAAVNTGGGGSGASAAGTSGAGGGGGAGGYCRKIQTGPLTATYVFTIGEFGKGGNAGASGAPGGNGGIGLAVVTAYWQ